MVRRGILLVEGPDDQHVLRNICERRGILQPDEIRDCGGYPQLIRSLPNQLRFGDPSDAYGVIVDADTDLASRWQSVRDRLRVAGYDELPAVTDPAGTVIEPPQDSILPRAGVWIMPNNQSPGALENLLRVMIPDGDELLSHAQACLDSLAAPPFREADKLKALMHTWLAWQKQPGRPYGTSIGYGFLNASVPQVDGLVAWLGRLIADP